jgi:hypothetical protein
LSCIEESGCQELKVALVSVMVEKEGAPKNDQRKREGNPSALGVLRVCSVCEGERDVFRLREAETMSGKGLLKGFRVLRVIGVVLEKS